MNRIGERLIDMFIEPWRKDPLLAATATTLALTVGTLAVCIFCLIRKNSSASVSSRNKSISPLNNGLYNPRVNENNQGLFKWNGSRAGWEMGNDNFAHQRGNYERFVKKFTSPSVWENKDPSTRTWEERMFKRDITENLKWAKSLFIKSLVDGSNQYGFDCQKIANKAMNPIQHFDFKKHSFFSLYHIVRRCAFFKDGKLQSSILTKEHEEPYFTQNTPEFRWRKMYNKICNKLAKLGLTNFFEKDYQKWMQPDNHYIGSSLTEKDIFVLPIY